MEQATLEKQAVQKRRGISAGKLASAERGGGGYNSSSHQEEEFSICFSTSSKFNTGDDHLFQYFVEKECK
eukprot:scaffold13468_cov95-Skeletonema_dohrnii-CCMP3373.AAC.6